MYYDRGLDASMRAGDRYPRPGGPNDSMKLIWGAVLATVIIGLIVVAVFVPVMHWHY
jgi:hypothetical protein